MTTATDAIRNAIAIRLESGRALTPQSIASAASVTKADAARELSSLTRSRALVFCGADGGHGHTHLKFQDRVYAR